MSHAHCSSTRKIPYLMGSPGIDDIKNLSIIFLPARFLLENVSFDDVILYSHSLIKEINETFKCFQFQGHVHQKATITAIDK